MTRPYAEVIGDPIAHSKSPLIHRFWLEKLGIEADYRAFHVRPGELRDYLEARRADPAWRGCNVTIPHKEAIGPSLDALEPTAARLGAVNTVVGQPGGRLLGANTDVDGIEAALGAIDYAATRAVVLGAGGAARAAFALLAKKRCRRVTVLARSIGKAERAIAECRLRAAVEPFAAGSGALEGATLLINATQLGMTGQDPMPEWLLGALAAMAPRALVFDMVYAPLETALLAAARERELQTADGLLMLVGQAATAFTHFFGSKPPRDQDDELRAMLTS